MVNPVARGDLAARLGSGRGLRVQTLYLAACSAFLFLSLPPEIGRIDLREANLLLAFLGVQCIAVAYLSSALASAEIVVEGEKGVPDLALSAFPAGVIASGKLASSAFYAAYLLAVAAPLFVLAAALRGAPLAPLAWAAGVTLVVATAVGVWGAWLGSRFVSDFTRSLTHWTMLVAIFGGTALLPASWWPLNPVRVIDAVIRGGPSVWLAAVAAGWLLLALAGTRLIVHEVHVSRGETGG